MPGMGLLRRRAGAEVNQPSAEAEAALTGLQQACGAHGYLAALKDVFVQVKECLASNNAVGAFRLLEATDLALEDDDAAFLGLPESTRTALMHLLCTAWVTVVRKLRSSRQLNSHTLPNWKFVLRRAIAAADQYNNTCTSEASCTQAPDVLQDLMDAAVDHPAPAPEGASGDDEDEEEHHSGAADAAAYEAHPDAAGNDPYNFDMQLAAFAGRMGTGGAKGLAAGGQGAAQVSSSHPSTADLEEDPQTWEGALARVSTRLPFTPASGGGGYSSAGEDGDGLPQSDSAGGLLSAGGDGDLAGGRLAALDDVALRPMLLRVVSRLPPGHAMRSEVEGEVGAAVGTAQWRGVLAEAEAVAESAGVALPAAVGFHPARSPPALHVPQPAGSDLASTDAPESVPGVASGEPGPLTLMDLTDLASAGDAPGTRRLHRGLSSLFSTSGGDGGLCGGEDGEDVAGVTAIGAGRSRLAGPAPTSFNSMASSLMAAPSSLLPSPRLLLPGGPSLRTAREFEGLQAADAPGAQQPGRGRDAPGVGSRADAGFGFLDGDSDEGPGGLQGGALSPSPWLGAGALGGLQGDRRSASPVFGADGLGQADSGFDAAWLAGDGGDGGDASWDITSLVSTAPSIAGLGGSGGGGGGSGGVKRTPSLLGGRQLPPTKQPRVA